MQGTKQVVVCDVDGVLALFTRAFAALCTYHTGKAVSEDATKWNWVDDYGVTQEEQDGIWKWIADNPGWWTSLQPYTDTFDVIQRLNTVAEVHDLYYMTTRPLGARRATEAWLREHGMTAGSVVVTGQKGKACQALGATAFLDDRPENVLDVYRSLSPTTSTVCLLARPWNEGTRMAWEEQAGRGGVQVVETVGEWLGRYVEGGVVQA